MALVFQYGSNCSEVRLNSRDRMRGDATRLGLAETVDNYELRFDVWSTTNRCAASDIVAGGDAPVKGVLYEVPDWLMSRETVKGKGRKSFDAIEGESTNYRRRKIRVRKCADGSIVDAVTYVVKTPTSGLETSANYVRHIVGGLRENGACEAYIKRVKDAAVANNSAIEKEVNAM